MSLGISAGIHERPPIVDGGKAATREVARENLAAERTPRGAAVVASSAIPQRSEYSADDIAPIAVHAPNSHGLPGTTQLIPIQGRRTAPVGNQSITHNPRSQRASFNKLDQRILRPHDAALHNAPNTSQLASARVDEKIAAQVYAGQHLKNLDTRKPATEETPPAPRRRKAPESQAPRFARNVTREQALFATLALGSGDAKSVGVLRVLAALGDSSFRLSELERNASRDVVTAAGAKRALTNRSAVARTGAPSADRAANAAAPPELAPLAPHTQLMDDVIALAKQAALLRPLPKPRLVTAAQLRGAIAESVDALTTGTYLSSGRGAFNSLTNIPMKAIYRPQLTAVA